MRRLVLLALLLFACSEAGSFVAPDNRAARSTLIFEVSERGVIGTAYDGDGSRYAVADLDGDVAEVWALYYDRTLAALGLHEGLIPQAQPDDPFRPIPAFTTGRRAILTVGGTVGFEEVRTIAGALAEFRLAVADQSLCANSGGCFFEGSCSKPCPVGPTARPGPFHASIEPPRPPMFAPCPEGWTERTNYATYCEPPERVASCPDGEAQWLDASTCAPIAVCPSGDWADALPADTIYVDPTANGTGSRASPFATIAQALTVASPGTTIALSPGTHVAPPQILETVTFVGVCPSRSVVVSSAGLLTIQGGAVGFETVALETFAAVVNGGALLLRRVDLRGPEAGVLAGPQTTVLADHLRLRGEFAADGAVVDILDSAIEDAVGYGIRALGASEVAVRNVAIVDVELTMNDSGEGVDAVQGSTVTLDRVSVLRAGRAGIVVRNAVLDVTDVVVTQTKPRSDGTGGNGLRVAVSSTVAARRMTIRDCRTAGVVIEPGARAELDDFFIFGTRSRDSDQWEGQALITNERSVVHARRWIVAENRDQGIAVRGGDHTFEDLAVLETRGRELDDRNGIGLNVVRGNVDMTRVLLSKNIDMGMRILEEASVSGEFVEVLDTQANVNGDRGEGVRVEGGVLSLEVASIARSRYAGLRVHERGYAMLDLVTISGTALAPDQINVGELIAHHGGRVEATDLVLRDGEGHGILASSSAEVLLNRASISNNGFGGLLARSDASVSGQNVEFVDNLGANLIVNTGGRIDFDAIGISGATGPMSVGVTVALDGVVKLHDFELVANGNAGLVFEKQADVTLTVGRIEGHDVGLLVGDVDYDLSKVLQGVTFVDNMTWLGRF